MLSLFRAILSLIVVWSVIGCGGSSKDSIIGSDRPHKFSIREDRTAWEEVNKPGESSLGVLQKSLDNGVLEFDLTTGETQAAYYQFFIDTDNNEQTGYRRGEMIDGADYLFEEGRLYRSTHDGEGWYWERIGDTDFSKEGGHVYAGVSIAELGTIDPHFRVAAVGNDQGWNALAYIKMEPINRGLVTVDADAGEWEHIPQWSSSDFGEMKMADDTTKLYFLIEKGRPGAHTQLYLNTDNDTSTGYTRNEFGEAIGADYLIEDERLYRSTVDGPGWHWERIGTVEYAREGSTIEIAVRKSEIGLAADTTFTAGAIGWDATFEEIISLMTMHQASLQNIKPLVISEVMAQNGHIIMDPDFYAFEDWMELHNRTDNTIDISFFKVSDKLDEAKWTIPAGTTVPPPGYLLIWADGKDKTAHAMHTNFSFKSKGEAAALYDQNGILIDGFAFGKQQTDISCRSEDGEVVYMEPTPGSTNGTPFHDPTLSDAPAFDLPGGFYQGVQQVHLSASNNAKIYYTTDGSYPTRSSTLYTGPIMVDHTTVIRARALEEDKLLSKERTATYLIDEQTTLPVISMALDSSYLFDEQYGIYVVGNNGTVNIECSGESLANFNQEWKRPARITFFDKSGQLGFSQEMDIKISGGCTRKLPQKSFSLKADSKYGPKYVEYKLFEDKDITRFKGFKLRNSGQDWFKTMLRDGFLQRVVKEDLDLDTQGYQPAILYINGRYWGIYNIREKRNEDYIAENHPDVDPDKVDLLYDHWQVKEGSAAEYEALMEYLATHDLSDEENYNYVASRIQIDNYIDYMIAETFVSNIDWPYVNTKYWKERKEGAKWRWILEDLDQSFSLWNDEGDVEHNMFEVLMAEQDYEYYNPPWSTLLFRSLIRNNGFKTKFVDRYNRLLDTTFQPDRVIGILDQFADAIAPEIPRHIERWGNTHPWVFDSVERWQLNLERIREFARRRPDIVRSQLRQIFGQ